GGLARLRLRLRGARSALRRDGRGSARALGAQRAEHPSLLRGHAPARGGGHRRRPARPVRDPRAAAGDLPRLPRGGLTPGRLARRGRLRCLGWRRRDARESYGMTSHNAMDEGMTSMDGITPLVEADTIAARVAELGRRISEDFEGDEIV